MSEPAPFERLPKATRLLKMAELLRDGQFSVFEIATKLYSGIDWNEHQQAIERAILRDLAVLEKEEPLFHKCTKKRPPRYWIQSNRSSLDDREKILLHSAARVLYHRSGDQAIIYGQVMKRLNAWLPAHLHSIVKKNELELGKRRRRSKEDLNLERAARAWFGGYALRFEYRKPGGSGQARTNILEIYLIEIHPQNLDLYVIGKEISFHNDVRTFKLSRMEHPHVLEDRPYRIPEAFDPGAFFHAALGVVGTQGQQAEDIQLRFKPDAAYRILEGGFAQLMPARQLNPDGSLDATLQAPLDSSGLPREALPWIYSFGPRVQVLGPAHIRAHWLRELEEVVNEAEDKGDVDITGKNLGERR